MRPPAGMLRAQKGEPEFPIATKVQQMWKPITKVQQMWKPITKVQQMTRGCLHCGRHNASALGLETLSDKATTTGDVRFTHDSINPLQE